MTDDDRPLIAGVCGQPIGQSKSPKLFQYWFNVYGIDGYYSPYLVAPDSLEKTLRAMPKMGLRGTNVTIPHKEAVLSIADEVSDAARAIGAANTITFGLDGAIHADNTDGFGFYENLKAGAPHWKASDGSAVLFGAGGAARAAIYVLLQAGCPEVRVTNRTRARAEELADYFGDRVKVVGWNERNEALAGASLIANSTSLGMGGQPPLEVSLQAAPDTTIVTDMVYNPLKTYLLASAESRGLVAIDGLGMLLHQARPGFQRWFGREGEVTPALRTACLSAGGQENKA